MSVGLMAVIVAFTVAVASAIGRRPGPREIRIVEQSPAAVRATDGHSIVERLGRAVRSMCRQPVDAAADRTVGVALAVVGLLSLVHPGLAAVTGFGIWARSVVRRRRVAQRRVDHLDGALGDVIDLFAVALLSGDTVAESVRQVENWAEGEVGAAFAWCNRQVSAGRVLSDALEEIPARLGAPIRPLVAALVATERYGAPITSSLAQLAIDTRSDRRRRAEASARRLPVLLLFPLVVCVLPAFLLVTVVPVIFETVTNFDFSASP